MTPRYDQVVPRASALLESLRGVGYSPGTAVADLIDNSITAGAKRIQVDFRWLGPASYVRVLDDGCGMDEVTLVDAMRPGSRSPKESRSADDLGRFGLGLKTASFSQCRVLTVISKRAGSIVERCWDLDYVSEVDEWRLLVGIPEGIGDEATFPADSPSGTIVLWSKLDRIVGASGASDKSAQDRFYGLARQVEQHLAMTFHRFLEGPRPHFELLFNGNEVKPWDPFLRAHPATTRTPVDRLGDWASGPEVQGFVLPHKDKLTPEEYSDAGGPEGWLIHQGFFVYRNLRLLVPGSWLALGTGRRWVRDELHRLARLRLDLHNCLDEDWKIDIKKSSASPPPEVRLRLQSLAERVRSDAREVFAYRGGRASRASSVIPMRAWNAVETKAGVSYRIARDHPSVRRVLDADAGQRESVEEMLRVIEASVPIQRIWLDAVEKGGSVAENCEEIPADLGGPLKSLYCYMLSSLSISPEAARSRLLDIEPFSRYPAAIAALPDALE